MSLYKDIINAGIPFSSHESDLYFQKTDQSLAILEKYRTEKSNSRIFINQAPPHKGELWIDVPFAYQPFWDRRQSK